jgi:hypothetical protein
MTGQSSRKTASFAKMSDITIWKKWRRNIKRPEFQGFFEPIADVSSMDELERFAWLPPVRHHSEPEWSDSWWAYTPGT